MGTVNGNGTPGGAAAGSVTTANGGARARQRAMMIAVDRDGTADLGELADLLRTAGVAPVGEAVQRRGEPDPDRYFGRGRLEGLKEEIRATGANLVACDDELAPRQERNLERALGVPVIDRTAIILDIFASHAHTAEGKLQVELAQLEYNLARMRGLWTHLERLGAGIGTRGPGESQIETDRRLARDRISALRKRMEGVGRTRGLMRRRREESHLPQVALAGYTNAGKSSLLRALTGAEVPVGDRPFHTLDPMTRSYRFEGRRYLVTDTVGFIEKLPHQLVEAFRATLDETVLADLILVVIDASSGEDRIRAEVAASDSVLAEIGADDRPRLMVLNKIDQVDRAAREDLRIAHPDAVQVSALEGEGVEELELRIARLFESSMEPVELLVPYEQGSRLHDLHEVASRIARWDGPEGVRVRARVPSSHVHRFRDLAV